MEASITLESIDKLNKNLHVFYGIIGAILAVMFAFLIVFFKIIKKVFKLQKEEQKIFLSTISSNLKESAAQIAVASKHILAATQLIQDMQRDYNQFIMSLASASKKESVIKFVNSTAKNRSEFVDKVETLLEANTDNSNSILEPKRFE